MNEDKKLIFLYSLVKMKDYFWINFKIMLHRSGFWIVTSMILLYSAIHTLGYGIRFWGQNLDSIASSSATFVLFSDSKSMIFAYASLILAILPYANAYIIDDRKHSQNLYFSRSGKRYWYMSQALCTIVGTFLAFFIGTSFSIVLGVIMFIENGNYEVQSLMGRYMEVMFSYATGEAASIPRPIPLRGLFYFFPNLYNLFYAALFSLTNSIVAGFMYSLSLYMKKMSLLIYVIPVSVVLLVGRFDTQMYYKGLSTQYPEYVTIFWNKSYYNYSVFFLFLFFMLVWTFVLSKMKEKQDAL